jgi:hypothetical protein
LIDLGDVYPARALVWDDTVTPAVLANAGAVVLTITRPDGTTVLPAVVNASTGTYTASFTPTTTGRFVADWVATGVNACAFTDVFDVFDAGNAIVSMADVRAHLNEPDGTDDEELRGFLLTASEWTVGRVGPVGPTTCTDIGLIPGRDGVLVLRHSPVLSLTTIVGAFGWAGTYNVTGYTLDGPAGLAYPNLGVAQVFGAYPVTVTYQAGRTDVPASVRLAVLMFVKTLWETQRGPGGQPQFQGEPDEAVADGGMGLAVWRAEQILRPYLLPPAVA